MLVSRSLVLAALGPLALALGCGARTSLGAGDSAPACGTGTARVLDSLVLEAPDDPINPTSEPRGDPLLVWTGSELLVAWTHWDLHNGYRLQLARFLVDGGALVPAGASALSLGKLTNNLVLNSTVIAWDGEALARFWPQDDGSILMQRLSADFAPLAEPTTIIPAGGVNAVTGAVATAGAYLVASLRTQSETSFSEALNVNRISFDGVVLAGPERIAGPEETTYGGLLTAVNGEPFLAWTATDSTMPSEAGTHVASIDSSSVALHAQQAVLAAGLVCAFVAESDRLDLALCSDHLGGPVPALPTAVLARKSADNDAFAARTTLPPSLDASLAVDRCGLVAMAPTGADELSATSLTLQRIGEHGPSGPPLALQMSYDALASALIAVDTGLAVAWWDANATRRGPLQLAYVAMP